MNDFTRIGTDLVQASQNLRAQKTRTMLTALGMVFGVGAVIGMLAIGAGAKQQALATIEALGVHNLMVDSIPPGSPQELQQRRMTSPGLTMRDVRIVEANLAGLSEISPRRSLQPQKLLPQPTQAMPTLEGVDPSFAAIHDFHELDGSFFDQLDNAASVPAAVLGQSAKVSLFGYTPAVGKYIKVNDAWLRVVGVLDEQLNGSGTGKDWNNVIFTPLNTFNNRFYDNSFTQKDFLDGVDMSLKPDANSVAAAAVVTAILNSTHHDTDDFNVTVPAALLAQKQQTQRIFTLVMVAVAAISLLVGGIGIMNIVLATVMERTREIGVRRATGARRADIMRQFLAEAILISVSGGAVGVLFGYILSWTIAATAHWPAIVGGWSIIIAFGVSVGVGVLFGIYPARKAARIDPIEALRYE